MMHHKNFKRFMLVAIVQTGPKAILLKEENPKNCETTFEFEAKSSLRITVFYRDIFICSFRENVLLVHT